MDLSIIIVNWNSADFVHNCINSILEETSQVNFEIIVVDNASYDGCEQLLLNTFPEVIFVQSQTNLGFAMANNLGVRYSRGPNLLFLNPDTVILDGAIDKLFKHYINLPEAGIVGCRLLNNDGSLQTSCVQAFPTIINQVFDAELFRRLFPKAKIWGVSSLFEDSKQPSEVNAISGACMLIDRIFFDTINHFSPDYFMYGEDIDLCFKAFLSGKKNYYVPDSEIIHHGGGSSQLTRSNFSNIVMRESIMRFLEKFRGRRYSVFYRIAISASSIFRLSIIGPITLLMFFSSRTFIFRKSFSKWFSIFLWGIGFKNCSI